MARVLTFSRQFPAYHPKAGQRTNFVEKILIGLQRMDVEIDEGDIPSWPDEFCEYLDNSIEGTKFHTIRSGHRWKAGDKFSPRVWSGKPYNSKQIIIAPDIDIKQVWDIEMNPSLFEEECFFKLDGEPIHRNTLMEIAKNDGLGYIDFLGWFFGSDIMSSKRKPFIGQIICWNENIEY